MITLTIKPSKNSSGVNYILRKVASKISLTVQLEKGDKNFYTFNIMSSFKNQIFKFKVNEEFTEETMDGRTLKTVVMIEGNKMIVIQKGEKTVRIERVFFDYEMIETCTVEGVVGTRWFKAN